MLHETFQFQKTLCDGSFTIATSIQENCESILKEALNLSPWIPEQGKKACLDSSEQYWLGLNKCRQATLASIDYFESLVLPPVKTKEKAKPPIKKTAPATKTTTARKTQKAKAAPAKPAQTTRKAADKGASTNT